MIHFLGAEALEEALEGALAAVSALAGLASGSFLGLMEMMTWLALGVLAWGERA